MRLPAWRPLWAKPPRLDSLVIIYGKPDDHLWKNLEEFGPFPFTPLVIIYGAPSRRAPESI